MLAKGIHRSRYGQAPTDMKVLQGNCRNFDVSSEATDQVVVAVPEYRMGDGLVGVIAVYIDTGVEDLEGDDRGVA